MDNLKYDRENQFEIDIDKGIKKKEELISKKARDVIASRKSKRPESRKKKSDAPAPLKEREKIKGAVTPKKSVKKISIKCAPKIRFSQLFVSPKTTCGTEISALVQNILKDGWDDTKPALKIVEMGDELPTSLDNRRLVALQTIAKIKPDFQFPVEKLPRDEPADPSLIGAIQQYYTNMDPLKAQQVKSRVEAVCKKQKIAPYTNGWAVISRMNQTDSNLVQHAYKTSDFELLEKAPLGFTHTPVQKTPEMMRHFSMLQRSNSFPSIPVRK